MTISVNECLARAYALNDNNKLVKSLMNAAVVKGGPNGLLLKNAAIRLVELGALVQQMEHHIRLLSETDGGSALPEKPLMIHRAHTPGSNWGSSTGNYGVETCVDCAWCGADLGITIHGESHDEEPCVLEGIWACTKCNAHGTWKGGEHDIVGPTGISTPGTVDLAGWLL